LSFAAPPTRAFSSASSTKPTNYPASAWKSAIIDECRFQPGAQVLDIGHGMSAEALDLATLDRRSDPPRHQPQHCRDVCAQCPGPRFPDPAFDAVRSERMLMDFPEAQ